MNYMVFNPKEYAHDYYLKNKERWATGGYSGKSDILVAHHVKYKEIHGIDEIIWLTPSEHKKLHIKLSKTEGYIKPSKEIIIKAKNRASQNRPYRLKYRQSERCKEKRQHYIHDHIFTLHFTENMGYKLRLMESIVYNTNTGDIMVTSCFYSTKITVKRIYEHESIISDVIDYL